MSPTIKKISSFTFCFIAVLLLFSFSSDAISGKNLKGNGFPSGFHYNLNLLGKKTQNPGAFSCPSPADYRCVKDDNGFVPCDPLTEECIYVDDADNNLFYCHESASQNVVFIPRYDANTNQDTSVHIQSGNTKGGKNRSVSNNDLDGDGIPDLQVTDWCVESFPDNGGNDSAVISLPPYDHGYAVFARITGKPCNNIDPDGNCETGAMFSNELGFIADDQGNDLLALGFVSPSGEWSDYWLQREEDGTQKKGPGGKGTKKATNITSAFTFSGTVCYISPGDQSYFCDAQGSPVDVDNDLVTDYWLPAGAWFWDDPDDNNDGLSTTEVGVNGEDDWADIDITDSDNGISDMLENFILNPGYSTVQGCDINAYCYGEGSTYVEITDQAGLDACIASVSADVASDAVPTIGYFNQWSDPIDDITNKGLVADAPAVASCKTWTDEWVFNISDFVDFIWGIDNKGSYNIQVRFYPYDQICEQLPGGCTN